MQLSCDWNYCVTYRSQSTARILLTSSVGNPNDVRTITMVTMPAWGTLAAPIEAAVDVILKQEAIFNQDVELLYDRKPYQLYRDIALWRAVSYV